MNELNLSCPVTVARKRVRVDDGLESSLLRSRLTSSAPGLVLSNDRRREHLRSYIRLLLFYRPLTPTVLYTYPTLVSCLFFLFKIPRHVASSCAPLPYFLTFALTLLALHTHTRPHTYLIVIHRRPQPPNPTQPALSHSSIPTHNQSLHAPIKVHFQTRLLFSYSTILLFLFLREQHLSISEPTTEFHMNLRVTQFKHLIDVKL